MPCRNELVREKIMMTYAMMEGGAGWGQFGCSLTESLRKGAAGLTEMAVKTELQPFPKPDASA